MCTPAKMVNCKVHCSKEPQQLDLPRSSQLTRSRKYITQRRTANQHISMLKKHHWTDKGSRLRTWYRDSFSTLQQRLQSYNTGTGQKCHGYRRYKRPLDIISDLVKIQHHTTKRNRSVSAEPPGKRGGANQCKKQAPATSTEDTTSWQKCSAASHKRKKSTE
jgi:hypothetical protein